MRGAARVCCVCQLAHDGPGLTRARVRVLCVALHAHLRGSTGGRLLARSAAAASASCVAACVTQPPPPPGACVVRRPTPAAPAALRWRRRRYMVVLRLGGVYADIDVECRAPLDGVIAPADTLLAGWEGEHADAHDAAVQQYARQRQVASWFFAAAPGHPVLRAACDHIARHALTVYSNSSVRDTQERTGQGLWTDLVVAHALQHPAAKVRARGDGACAAAAACRGACDTTLSCCSCCCCSRCHCHRWCPRTATQHDDPWKVRILPRVAFGARPSDASALGPELPGVVVLHHFLGSWQSQASWHAAAPAHRKALQILAPLLPWARCACRGTQLLPLVLLLRTPAGVCLHPALRLQQASVALQLTPQHHRRCLAFAAAPAVLHCHVWRTGPAMQSVRWSLSRPATSACSLSACHSALRSHS